MSKPRFVALIILSLLILCHQSHGHLVPLRQNLSSSDAVISDGVVHEFYTSAPKNYLTQLAADSSTCEETYGFMPCSTGVLGNLFLMAVYAYLMYKAATFLKNGSEILLEILGPGIIGGLVLPILGSLPSAMLILVSGISGSTITAQSHVSVGMGLLAGSTVLVLTLIWGSCVVAGKCDIEDGISVDAKDTYSFSLTRSGVSTDIWTSYSAMIMAVSIIPFIIVQLPQLLSSTTARKLAILIALIVSVALLFLYGLYQLFQPRIQMRRLAYAKHKHFISGVLQNLRKRALGKLFRSDGELDTEVLKKLFDTIDVDKDGHLSHTELRALIVGIRMDEVELDKDDACVKVMRDFDTSGDDFISFEEFTVGVSKWLKEAQRAGRTSSDTGHETMKILSDFHSETKREHDRLGADRDQSDEVVEGVGNRKWTSIKAGLMLLAGILIAAAFADPLVDVVVNFSDATSIPTFFVSFIALPLATNSSEFVSAVIFASRKKRRTASLTFSELYGAATMNNIICLSVLLALVYIRGLAWDFSAEVLVILIVSILVGVSGSLCTTFPLWTCSMAYLLYPFSLLLVYVLDYVLGWS